MNSLKIIKKNVRILEKTGKKVLTASIYKPETIDIFRGELESLLQIY